MVVDQFGIYLVRLDPSLGSEIQKTRPCLVVSPNEMNKYLSTVIITPLTSTIRNYPTRLNCVFDHKAGQLAFDQIRSVDKSRLIKKIGEFRDKNLIAASMKILQEMFALKS